MKKTFCIILAVTMLFTAASALGVSAEPSDLTNVAEGCTYTYTQPYVESPDASPYRQVDGKELTDGVIGDTKFGTEWIGWYYKEVSECEAVIDLGKQVDGIVKASLVFGAPTDWGVGFPSYVKFYASNDGKTFTDLGQKTKASTEKITDISVTMPDGISARYIKAVVGKGSGIFAFCSEFQVFTGTLGDESEDDNYSEPDYNPSNQKPEDPTAKAEGKAPDYSALRVMYNSGEYLEQSNGYGFGSQKLLRGVRAGTEVSDFMQTLGTTSAYVTGADGSKKTDGKVVNGDKACQGDDSAMIVIIGDVDPDGSVGDDDCAAIKDIAMGKKAESLAKAASDVYTNRHVDALDYVMVKRHISGKYNIYAQYDDPDRSEKSAMTYRFDSASLFSVTVPKTSVGTVRLTFDKKSWGTWNIGTWFVDGANVAGGGTDWEYVYRAGETTSSIAFSGGNHGNEDLLSLKLYDNATGKELSQTVGTTAEINGLKVVEKTQIKYNNSDKAFMAVTRTYYVIGERITLETSYELLNDTHFDVSYTGMFPVPKTQGLYITFNKNDGSKVDFTSLKVGASDYSGPYYGKTNSASVTISGYTGKNIVFNVTAYGEDATQNFDSELKTFYWDMNSTHNKLYFSISGSKAKAKAVPTGVRWSTKVTWEMSPAKAAE